MDRFKAKNYLVNSTETQSLLEILKDLNLLNKLNIHSLFNCLPKNTVVHEFAKIFLKIVAGVLSCALIKIGVGFKPIVLLKRQYLMNFGRSQP